MSTYSTVGAAMIISRVVQTRPRARDIREARKRAGLTQAEAAKLIGYSERTWQDWEYGMRPMRAAAFYMFKESAGL